MKILTAEQVREIDRLTSEKYGIPSLILMENAGMRVVEALEERFDNLVELSIGILCGKGNNGGDGLVVARQLIQKGCFPLVFLFAQESEVKGDARTNLDILTAMGYPPTVVANEHDWSEEKLELIGTDIIVDALLGTGLTKPADGLYKAVIESMCGDFPDAFIVSIDVPSGLPSNTGRPIGPAVGAGLTVTLTAPKFCLVLPPNHDKAGDVVIANIGSPAQLLDSDDLRVNLILPEDFTRVLETREDDTNKGTYGKVLIVGGSRGKTGAAAMTGQAALRSGAGLVTVATAESVLPIIAGSMPELMTEPLAETEQGTISLAAFGYGQFEKMLVGKTVLGIGPGLSTQTETAEFVRSVLRMAKIPTVIDADGLNAVVGHDSEIGGTEHSVVITPHPGEMARLIGRDVDYVIENRIDVAQQFALSHPAYVVLKGFRTIIAAPDGTVYVNPTGNPGMATGGTGDVLTGMIVGILAQENLGTFVERLCLAVYLHGLAGDIAAEKLGEETMVATDILRFLPQAWDDLRASVFPR